MTHPLYKPNRLTKKVKLNIVMEIVASNYLAQQLKDDLEYKVLTNCFKTNDRQLLSVKLS
jgi:transposase